MPLRPDAGGWERFYSILVLISTTRALQRPLRLISGGGYLFAGVSNMM